jgi:hypothetical protein
MTGFAAIALGPSARLTRSRTSRLDLTRGELRLTRREDRYQEDGRRVTRHVDHLQAGGLVVGELLGQVPLGPVVLPVVTAPVRAKRGVGYVSENGI